MHTVLYTFIFRGFYSIDKSLGSQKQLPSTHIARINQILFPAGSHAIYNSL